MVAIFALTVSPAGTETTVAGDAARSDAASAAVANLPLGLNAAPSSFGRLGHGWLTLDTNLRSTSHVSAWAIDQYLAANTNLPALGHAFKTAEAKYDVNALYLLAHAMHETAFGTSYIAQQFHNLFGWNALDRDPVGFATRFPTYAQSIDFVASQIVDRYLSRDGQFFGGAATLRGMRYYASDPAWGTSIVGIANNIVLSTLANRRVRFAAPSLGELSTGRAAVLTVSTRSGSLPDGLEAAYRFVPVAVVEAAMPNGQLPSVDPSFRLADGESHNGAFRLTITTPARPGRYRLELQVRDSDGTPLTEYGVPAIPATTLRVFGSDAVTYQLSQVGTGLRVTVRNVGRQVIPAVGIADPAAQGGTAATATTATATPAIPGPSGANLPAASADPTGAIPGPSGANLPTASADPTTAGGGIAGTELAAPATTIAAWLIGSGGTATLLGRIALDADLRPGASWSATFSADGVASLLPGILLVRLQVAGEPSRLAGSPPGVFVIAAPKGSQASPGPKPLSVTPSANGSTDATPPLSIGSVNPVDPTTQAALDRATGGTTPSTKPATAKTKVKALPAVALTYVPRVSATPGVASIRLTNVGSATLHALMPMAAGATAVPQNSEVSTTKLLVTAVPAWGPGIEPVQLLVELEDDLAPGRWVDLTVVLPAPVEGASTYLVSARILASDPLDRPSGGPALFWMRSRNPVLPTAIVPATPSPTPTPPTSPTASPPPAPAAAPVATPAPSPTPKATAPAKPAASKPNTGTATASRLRVIKPLAGHPGLWVYVVRTGDVYESIAHWFGVSVSTMRRLNPNIAPRLLHAGQRLTIPTPTR